MELFTVTCAYFMCIFLCNLRLFPRFWSYFLHQLLCVVYIYSEHMHTSLTMLLYQSVVVYMYNCTYTCVYTAELSKWAYIQIYKYTNIEIFNITDKYIHTQINTNVQIYKYTNIHSCIHIYTLCVFKFHLGMSTLQKAPVRSCRKNSCSLTYPGMHAGRSPQKI